MASANLKILSVNIGKRQSYDVRSPSRKTGNFKYPAFGPVWLGRQGVGGDTVVNTKHYGGPGQAVYLYTEEDYDWWAQQGIAPVAGLFGENLTVCGFQSGPLCAGDRLAIGAVELEITAPRIPCATFAAKMNDSGWVKRFRAARLPGAYARVIVEGEVEAGQGMELRAANNRALTRAEQFDLFFESRPSLDRIDAVLSMPVAERERAHYEGLRAKLCA